MLSEIANFLQLLTMLINFVNCFFQILFLTIYLCKALPQMVVKSLYFTFLLVCYFQESAKCSFEFSYSLQKVCLVEFRVAIVFQKCLDWQLRLNNEVFNTFYFKVLFVLIQDLRVKVCIMS